MQVFLTDAIRDDGATDHYVFFATDQDRANRLFRLLWLERDQIPDEWSGDQWEQFQRCGTPEQAQAALDLDSEGLGVYDPDEGWSIIPIDPSLR